MLSVGLGLVAALNVSAQDSHKLLPWTEQINSVWNVASESNLPTYIYLNPLSDRFAIDLSYRFARGDFHAADASSKVNGLPISIGGSHRFKNVECYGNLEYLNSKEFSRRWNSTMMTSEQNPFVLCDSVPSDFTSDRFRVNGGVSYNPWKGLVLAADLDYTVGSSATQNDPRPKTDAMHFTATPAIAYKIGAFHTVGISEAFNLYKETISHTVINTQESQNYFLMRGSGIYFMRSTGSSMSYPREYSGMSYKTALQYVFDNRAAGLGAFVNIYYTINKETARDGGTKFTFLGGDMRESRIGGNARFDVRSSRFAHSITLGGENITAKGTWYDQKEFLDPDRNNELNYKVLASSIVNTQKITSASLHYTMSVLKGLAPTWQWSIGATFRTKSELQHEDDGYLQKSNRLKADLSVVKYLNMRHCLLLVGIDGGYTARLGSSSVDDIKTTVLSDLYTLPAMEYASASYASAGITVDASFPVTISKSSCFIGAYVKFGSHIYTGDSKYSNIYKDTYQIAGQAGLNFKF